MTATLEAAAVESTTTTVVTNAPGVKKTRKAKAKSKKANAHKSNGHAKANGKPKSKKGKVKKVKAVRKAKDDARLVARASEGRLDSNQVRILRALIGTRKPELTRAELKDGVGIGAENRVGGPWNKSLWALYSASQPLMTITEHGGEEGAGHKYYTFMVTARGREVLEKAEKGAKELAKAAA